jgi:hypothetical protein
MAPRGHQEVGLEKEKMEDGKRGKEKGPMKDLEVE